MGLRPYVRNVKKDVIVRDDGIIVMQPGATIELYNVGQVRISQGDKPGPVQRFGTRQGTFTNKSKGPMRVEIISIVGGKFGTSVPYVFL